MTDRSYPRIPIESNYLLVGLLVHAILKLLGVPEKLCPYSTIVWLFTPFTFTLGTRGNCEPIVCAMILWIIVCLMNGNMCQATLWYGLVVYLRICPIIYALPIILLLDPLYFGSGKKTQPYSLGSWESPVSPEFIQHQRYQAVHYDKNIYLYENYIWVDFWSCILLLLDGILFLLVMTAQYFVWFFCILPLILPWSNMKL